MKCDVCLEKLEEYLDGELFSEESNQVAAHLITCTTCATESSALTTELEMYSTYDRELEVPVSMWEQIAESTASPVIHSPVPGLFERFASLFRVPSFAFSIATAAVLIVIGIILAGAYMDGRKGVDKKKLEAISTPSPSIDKSKEPEEISPVSNGSPEEPRQVVAFRKPRTRKMSVKDLPVDKVDVVSSDFGYMDIGERDTARHLEQTQNLLRSIRNVALNDNGQEIDVSYDKAESRRLLNENIVLRREAEMKARFPAKELLSDLEPFLIDIANLPDFAKPDDVRVIKERVKKTEIVAALIGYE